MKNKIKLPPRKWYSLQQAADKLTRDTREPVTVDDLIHYAAIGVLQLSIKVITRGKNNISFPIFKNKTPKEFGYCISHNIKSNELIEVRDEDQGKRTLRVYDKENKKLYMNGFLSIVPLGYKYSNFESALMNGRLTDFNLFYPDNLNRTGTKVFNTKLIIYNEGMDNLDVSYDDIYILNDEMELLKNGGKKIEYNYTIESKKDSPRKEVNQLDFIRVLLKLYWGTDDPNECRKILDSAKLAREFAKANVEPNITPETLRNWLRSEK